MSVVAYHAFPSIVNGGFIGVDIFFVISGYLISTIIFENLDRDTFSFTQFYARRIKRIFPALLLVLIVSFVFGWFTLLADEYKQLGKHIAAGSGFISNFVLWNEAGYFDNSGESKPLLHLWSLGIEEQFYIVWPPILWLVWKKKFNPLAITILLAISSFVLNVKGVERDSVATFYAPQTRFWELLSGSLLAWVTIYKKDAWSSIQTKLDTWLGSTLWRSTLKTNSSVSINVLSFIGFLLLVYGFRHINQGVHFPGTWALVPVVGTVLLIAAGPKTWINRKFLSNRLAVWFGLISFPLYLWHWPLLSFARIVEGQLPSRSTRMIAIVLSVVLAWLTYKLVERHIRFGGYNKAKVATLIVLMCFVGYIGYNTYSRDGLNFRFNTLSPEYKSQLSKIANVWKFRGYPEPQDSFIDAQYGFLRIGHNDKDIVLFVGDSHTQHYWNTVGELYKNKNTNGTTKPSVMFANLGIPPNFSDALLTDPSIKTVIFSYFWSIQYGSSTVNQVVRCCGGGKNGSIGENTTPLLSPEQMNKFDNKFIEIASALKSKGKEVYFVLDNPFGEENDPHSMLNRGWKGFEVRPPVVLTKETALARAEPVRSRIIRVAKKSGANVIDPFEFLCAKNICPAFSDEGELLYKDYDHLSLFASQNKIPYLRFILEK